MKLLLSVLLLGIVQSTASFSADSPIRAELRLGNLSHLKEALTTPPRGVYNPDIALATGQAPTREQRQVIIQSMLGSYHLRSWLLLGDALDSNPLLTPALKRLRSQPDCYLRILLEIIDRDLAKAATVGDKQSILFSMFNPAYFDPVKWTSPHRDNRLEFRFHLEGTRSNNGRNGRVSDDLARHVNQLKELWRFDRPGPGANNTLAVAERAVCADAIDLREVFNWTDLKATDEVLANRGMLSESDWMKQLDQLVQSTAVPQPEGENERKIASPTALALRPVPGAILDERALPTPFYPMFFKLLYEKAFDGRGKMTPSGCEAVNRLVSWANFVGLGVNADPDDRKRQGVEFAQLKQTYKIMVASIVAVIKGQDLAWLPCAHAMTALNQFWNSQVDLQGWTLQFGASQGGDFREMRGPNFFWGENLVGYSIGQGFGLLKGLGRKTKKAVTRDPVGHFALQYPGEWAGAPPESGFGLRLHPPSKIGGPSIEEPSDAPFDRQIIATSAEQQRQLKSMSSLFLPTP
jgi:hypothetical protein